MRNCDRQQGFTLVELMVGLAVLAILTAAARWRKAANDGNAAAFWNTARFEAVKRNAMVKVGVQKAADGTYCFGAATTTNPSDGTPCDCTVAVPAANICNVARFPTNQEEWNGVSLDTGTDVAVLEAKRGSLADSAGAGVLASLSAPTGPMDYTLNLHVDAMGRAVLCQSSGDTDTLSDYEGRQCSP